MAPRWAGAWSAAGAGAGAEGVGATFPAGVLGRLGVLERRPEEGAGEDAGAEARPRDGVETAAGGEAAAVNRATRSAFLPVFSNLSLSHSSYFEDRGGTEKMRS